eukprot:jgi/Tetstr1/437221/TSEL_025951.t1
MWHVAPGDDSNHAGQHWAAHGLSDVCHDVKSALGVGVQILMDPSSATKYKYGEGVRNAAGKLRFVPFAISLAPHAEAFLVE